MVKGRFRPTSESQVPFLFSFLANYRTASHLPGRHTQRERKDVVTECRKNTQHYMKDYHVKETLCMRRSDPARRRCHRGAQQFCLRRRRRRRRRRRSHRFTHNTKQGTHVRALSHMPPTTALHASLVTLSFFPPFSPSPPSVRPSVHSSVRPNECACVHERVRGVEDAVAVSVPGRAYKRTCGRRTYSTYVCVRVCM